MKNEQRRGEVKRRTSETDIAVSVNLDGSGQAEIATGVGFFDHMLHLLARHSLIDLVVRAEGDLRVDGHHTVEDVGIALGQALDQALGQRAGITRYGEASVPMDETLAVTVVDLGGRPYLVYQADFAAAQVGGFDVELVREFLLALANNARMNLHVRVAYGSNAHHMAEAIFKSLARALRQAVQSDPRSPGVPSTKGSLKG